MNSSTATRDSETERGSCGYNAYLEGIGKIFFHVYASSAAQPFDAEKLHELLRTSRRNNAALGVSGMLLYQDGHFLQVIEGRESAVRGLAEKIHRDPRHTGVITLSEGFENEYQFPDWSMGFQDLQSEEARTTPGYSDFLDTSFNPKAFSADPTLAQSLLLIFRKII